MTDKRALKQPFSTSQQKPGRKENVLFIIAEADPKVGSAMFKKPKIASRSEGFCLDVKTARFGHVDIF